MTRPTPRQARLRQIGIGFVVGVLVAVLAGGAIGRGMNEVATAALATVTRPFLPDFDTFEPLAASTKVTAADGTLLAELDRGEHRDPVDLDTLPEHVVQAVLAAEDHDFYQHRGFDVGALGRAALRTATGDLQGGSTITQQLAKLNYAGNERSILRKVKEALYAVSLEHEHDKDELLERYLNQVYLGAGAHGIASAAATFFGAEVHQLTAGQAATLAGKIRSPEALDPFEDPEAVLDRRDQVLGLMANHGWLDEDELEAALAEPLTLVERTSEDESSVAAPYFLEAVKREALEIEELGGSEEARRRRLLTGGLTIETTLDAAAQANAEALAQARFPEPDDPALGIVTVHPGDGAIRVLVGGVDFGTQKFDTATQAERQPGSAFKPFVYLAAIGKGIHPDSRLAGNSPTTFSWAGEPYEVRNYDDRSYGERIPMRDALVRSINTAFVDLALEIDPSQAIRTAHRAGITADISPVPAVALGGISPGVTPLEMATAYATFAAGGTRAGPYAISRILGPDGELVYQRQQEIDGVFAPEEVGVLNAGLRDVVRRGTGRAAAFGRDAAGKTGTTTDNRDAWFVGFTPQRSTAVWIGHLDNSPLPGLTGGSAPAELFAQVMAGAHEGLEVEPVFTASPDQLSLTLLEPPTTLQTRPSTTAGRRTTEDERETTTTEADTTTTTTEDDTSTTTTGAETTTTEPETTTTTEPDATTEGGSTTEDSTASSSSTDGGDDSTESMTTTTGPDG